MVQNVHLIIEIPPPTSVLHMFSNIVPGLACPYMPSWSFLNSIAEIKGSTDSKVLIKKMYSTMPKLECFTLPNNSMQL